MAPVSDKDRQAKRRASLKKDANAYQLHLQQERERKRKTKNKFLATASADEIASMRHKAKLKSRAQRAKKVSQPSQRASTSTVGGYRTVQSKCKAVKKATSMLPSSPTKRLSVVHELASREGIAVSPPASASSSRQGLRIDGQTTALVEQFYDNDEVSWQAPGRKDRVIIRQKNSEGRTTKRTVQCRYMLMSLAEAHGIFMTKHNENQIGLSKFCELRPKHIKLFEHIPHNVCVCIYHENVRLLLTALSSHTQLATDFQTFIRQIVCDDTSYDCMTMNCTACKDGLTKFRPDNSNEVCVKYKQWQSRDGIQEKVELLSNLIDVFSELVSKLPQFLRHTYIKREQAAYMQQNIKQCDGETVVLQVDFSENAAICNQDEIQSAHWTHGQATLFTAHAWIKESVTKSIVIMSDYLQHNKYSVYAFLDYIFEYLKSNHPTIRNINVFSDGAASQFKQRYLFSNLHEWQKSFSLSRLSWSFFATSHGKGVVDGLGGTVKRAVWRQIRSRRSLVTDAKQYAEVAKERNPNVHIKFIGTAQIEANVAKLDTFWDSVLAVPGTLQFHCVFPLDRNTVMVAETSASTTFSTAKIRDSDGDSDDDIDHESEPEHLTPSDDSDSSSEAQEDFDFAVGDWCVVSYDNARYPGEIKQMDGARVVVKVMVPSGNVWKWPAAEDILSYSRQQIVNKIAPPTLTGSGSRQRFNFSVPI